MAHSAIRTVQPVPALVRYQHSGPDLHIDIWSDFL